MCAALKAELMANMAVALMRRVKTDAGWSYYPSGLPQ
jgi:hypothetical protein